jgi:hypothetical protein
MFALMFTKSFELFPARAGIFRALVSALRTALDIPLADTRHRHSSSLLKTIAHHGVPDEQDPHLLVSISCGICVECISSSCKGRTWARGRASERSRY